MRTPKASANGSTFACVQLTLVGEDDIREATDRPVLRLDVDAERPAVAVLSVTALARAIMALAQEGPSNQRTCQSPCG
jgi:hypothetical protein